MGAFLNPRTWKRDLFGRPGPEPSYPRLPQVTAGGESSVPGIYVVGEVGGTPLIKLGLNQGVEVMDRIAGDLGTPSSDPNLLDVVVVGAGASGLAAAFRAKELKLRYVVLEADRLASTVVNMYRGKWLFAEPLDVSNRSRLWFEECTRETLLERWGRQVRDEAIELREGVKVTGVRKDAGGFTVTTDGDAIRARRIILAVGKAGNPRKAGVPGEAEHAGRLHHALVDPDAHRGERILVYGGGDVALEAALALCDRNTVTLATIDPELVFPRKRNIEALRREEAAGRITVHLATRLRSIGKDRVTLRGPDDHDITAANDTVFEMIGSELPLELFRQAGIRLEGSWHARRWAALAAVSVGVYSLYALKKFPETPFSWPFSGFISHDGFAHAVRGIFGAAFLPFRGLFTPEAYRQILDTLWFQQGYLYSLLYTLVMIVFGGLAFRRWAGIARNPRYQKWRYTSLISFQVVFFLLANVVAVQALSVQYSWRAWGLYQPWPLFFNTFSWWSRSDPRVVLYGFVGAGLLGTFVAIPWLSVRHGKRFCTWVCGCGGLAETLGDRWRHLAPKGKRSRAWEFQGAVVLVAALLVTVVTVGIFHTRADNAWARAYSYVVDFWLVAVIPVALYPFFGGKVWCRYWCPLAAWNQILAGWYGRLRIRSNEKCITCGLCSRHCQVGVDVMAFARGQESFDNRNSSCIQCGICIDVCPMDVLAFDAGSGEDAAAGAAAQSAPAAGRAGSRSG